MKPSALLLALVLALLPARALADAARPNVLLVVWDTARADHLSLYGYSRETTPNLERIAADALVFERAQASAYWTLPSAASLFTGLFAHNHGVDYAEWKSPDYTLDLPDRAVTLAEVLKAAGYRTALFSASGLVAGNRSYAQGFDVYRSANEEVLAERALSFADESGDTPWFVVLWYLSPHAPYEPEPEYDLWSPPDAPAVNIRACHEGNWKPGYLSQCAVNRHEVKLSEEQFEQLRRQYDGEIRRNDARLGELWAGLQQRGLADGTLFVFTSDHGEAFGEHELALVWHDQPYFETQDVPLVLRLPGRLPAKRVRTLVRNMDIFPTVLELAGLEPPVPINAESLLPAIADDAPDRPNVGFNHAGMHYYRNGRYRLIYIHRDPEHPFVFVDVFDEENDPREQHDLADERPDLAASLRDEMERFVEATRIPLGERGGRVTDEQIEMLRQMGYVE